MKTLYSALMATALVLTIGFITTTDASAREINRDNNHMNRANHSQIYEQQRANHYGIKMASNKSDNQYNMHNRMNRNDSRNHRGFGSCWR